MTHPPAAPGPAEGHDATQSFPAGAAPPPPPPEHAPAPPPIDPGVAPAHGSHGGYGGGGPIGPPPGGYPAAWGPGGSPPAPAATPAPGRPAAPGSAAPPARRRGRILGRAVLVLVVIGALAGTTAWGFVNRSSAERWKERSEAAEADLRQALDRLETTGDELEDARTRLRELANEAAGETDRNRILSDIVAQAPEVTDALADCQQETTDLANDVIAAFGDPAADVTGLQLRVDEVNEICATALGQAEDLEAAIEELGI